MLHPFLKYYIVIPQYLNSNDPISFLKSFVPLDNTKEQIITEKR